MNRDSATENIMYNLSNKLRTELKLDDDLFQMQQSRKQMNKEAKADIVFATAAVASAYAISMLEEEEEKELLNKNEQGNQSMTRPISVNESKRGRDSASTATSYSKISRWLCGKEPIDERSQQPGSKRQTSGSQATVSRGRTIDSMRLQGKVDAWEMKKLDKMRKRCEKMKTTILEWESNKKLKAKRHLEQKQGDLECRRVRALGEYRNDVLRIKKIAREAKAIAEERMRNDELVVLEKAKTMQSMGRVPRRCLCF